LKFSSAWRKRKRASDANSFAVGDASVFGERDASYPWELRKDIS
jgi:hypothetical protein